MSQSAILMIYMEKKGYLKSRKGQSRKVVIIALQWVFLLLNFIKEDKWFLASEEAKFVRDVKEQVMKVEF